MKSEICKACIAKHERKVCGLAQPYKVLHEFEKKERVICGESFEDVMQKLITSIEDDTFNITGDINPVCFPSPVQITDMYGVRKLFDCESEIKTVYTIFEV